SSAAASAAAESAAAAVAGFLALPEEGLVVHRLAVRVFFQHVPHVVVVVRDAAAQARGLHQAPPYTLVRGEIFQRDKLPGHHIHASCCPGVSATYGASRSLRSGLARALRIAPIE